MTPRKVTTRQQSQALTAIHPSDYESDINNLSDVPPPPPATRTNAQLNFSVIRRYIPSVTSLVSIAPYAVVYLFSPTSQQWEKSGTEGTLFVCQLSATEAGADRFSVIVLNRRGLSNFQVDLQHGEDVQLTNDYVILRVYDDEAGIQNIYGLWIFSEPPPSSTANTRVITAQIIRDCATQAETSRKITEDQQGESTNGHDVEQEAPQSEAMGRQVSLRELFGQQREQDDGWSVKHHSPRTVTPQFIPSADTEFFRTTRRHAQPR
ncbi:mRNA-decapping enzyme 1B [Acarospora aff. strigata]|nr:mRNA-decapping enzyme 1B [Acarospora aff. strigata]